MTSKYWIKLYHEILDDPKMMRMDEVVFARCIKIFLLAGKANDSGYLPCTADIAWHLRLSDDEIEATLAELQRVNIIIRDGERWLVRRFAARNEAMPPAEKMRYYRQEQKSQEYHGEPLPESDEPVTNSVTNSHTESDKESDKEIETDPESLPPEGGEKGNGRVDKDEYKQRIVNAVKRGADRDYDLKEAIENEFHIMPNWDTKTARAFMQWLKTRSEWETVADFAVWWWSEDWRGKDGQPPTLAQIRELWPQAFIGLIERQYRDLNNRTNVSDELECGAWEELIKKAEYFRSDKLPEIKLTYERYLADSE